jgi:hypothetical protein
VAGSKARTLAAPLVVTACAVQHCTGWVYHVLSPQALELLVKLLHKITVGPEQQCKPIMHSDVFSGCI